MSRKSSRRMREANEAFDRQKMHSLTEAIAQLGRFPKTKFDETVEVYAHLNVDPRQSTQMVRGTVALPRGSGKQVTVIVFTTDPDAAIAAGAEHAGLGDLIEKIQGGWLEFDTAIATPDAMKEVRKVARVLGPRGLMPNPKSGTVTEDVASAIQEVKAGRVEYKMDKTANVSIVVGKRSFEPEALEENTKAAIHSLAKARPEAFKGSNFIKSVTLSATMSPGVRLDPRQLDVN